MATLVRDLGRLDQYRERLARDARKKSDMETAQVSGLAGLSIINRLPFFLKSLVLSLLEYLVRLVWITLLNLCLQEEV